VRFGLGSDRSATSRLATRTAGPTVCASLVTPVSESTSPGNAARITPDARIVDPSASRTASTLVASRRSSAVAAAPDTMRTPASAATRRSPLTMVCHPSSR
jgi:hypothetical protein